MKKTQIMLLSMAVTGAITLLSCSFFEGSAKHREKGTPIESTAASVKKISDDRKGNEGKRFAITGYLNYAAAMRVYTSRPQTVYVSSEPGKKGEVIATVEMGWKENGHNSVFVPKDGDRDASNTIFYDNDGKPLTMNDKVTVSFSVSDNSIYLTETRIDKAQ